MFTIKPHQRLFSVLLVLVMLGFSACGSGELPDEALETIKLGKSPKSEGSDDWDGKIISAQKAERTGGWGIESWCVVIDPPMRYWDNTRDGGFSPNVIVDNHTDYWQLRSLTLNGDVNMSQEVFENMGCDNWQPEPPKPVRRVIATQIIGNWEKYGEGSNRIRYLRATLTLDPASVPVDFADNEISFQWGLGENVLADWIMDWKATFSDNNNGDTWLDPGETLELYMPAPRYSSSIEPGMPFKIRIILSGYHADMEIKLTAPPAAEGEFELTLP